MRYLVFAAAALAISVSPAVAGPGKGGGKGKGNGPGAVVGHKHGNGRGQAEERGRNVVVDAYRNDRGRVVRYSASSCPPGLRWKNNGCVPPGQLKRRYAIGTRLDRDYGYTPYASIPVAYRTYYGLPDNYRYIYRDGYIYQVDPTSYIVRQVIEAILR